MNIVKRSEGTYRATVMAGKGADGKYQRRTKTIKAKNLTEARKLAMAFQMEVEAGSYISPDKMTFEGFIAEWRSKYADRELSPKTVENYLVQINNRILPEFGHLRIDQIKQMHILAFLEKIQRDGGRGDGVEGRLSTGMVSYIYMVLKSIFSRAVDWKVIQNNPMTGIKKPKIVQKEMEIFDTEEAQRLLQALDGALPMWKCLITLALMTGLRKGELLALEWKNVDLETGVIDVKHSLTFLTGVNGGYVIKEPKTKGSIRKVSVPASQLPELRALKLQGNKDRMAARELWEGGERFFVFSAWNGKPLHPSSVQSWWGPFTKRHGLKSIRFHDLRHTSATLLINQGVHAKVISERLGHSGIQTTMNVYGHVLRSADHDAAQKFDDIFDTQKNRHSL